MFHKLIKHFESCVYIFSVVLLFTIMFCCVLLKRGARPFPGRCTMAFGFRLPGPQSDCQTERGDICQIVSTEVIFVALSNSGEGDICQISRIDQVS